nr:hypothetical protein BaRGS_025682 [Batillaria attramentaria]
MGIWEDGPFDGKMRPRGALPFLEWQVWQLAWLVVTLVARGNAQASAPWNQERFQFTRSLYNGTVPENAVGKVYMKTPVKMGIHLVNPDPVEVDYVIIGGDDKGIFHAESIKVEDFCFLRVRTKTGAYGNLNREHRQQYYLRVRATGRYYAGPTLEAYADLNITLLDQNEFSPLFPSKPFSVTIPEDTPIHSSIAEVKATDAEVGINGEIYYSLVNPSPMFAIHPTSGVVSLMRSLKYQSSSYELEIHAEDRGLKSSDRPTSPLSDTRLRITVTPVNYHPPTVLVNEFPAIVENINQGAVFAVVTVTDLDSGRNGEIEEVRVADQSTLFRIEPGVDDKVYNVEVASTVDREQFPDGLNITIIAVDRGQPPLSSSVVVRVQIQDVNDNLPLFEKDIYQAELPEIVPVHTPVLFVKATDKDEGKNGEVRYSIVDEEASKLFSIDAVTGLITTAAELDAEGQKQIKFRVQAEDSANSGTRKSGHTRVVISVKDFNDNAPVFQHLEPVFVSENLPKGSSVATVKASDVDMEENGYISYSITNSKSVPFDVDPFSGVIKTTEVLDFETMRKVYSVRVRASDWGSPFRQESESVLTVKLQDANDNSPEFERTRCKGYLSREAAKGTEIVVLTAIDFDAGNIVSYSIKDGNEDGCFRVVSQTGSVQLECDLTGYQGDERYVTVVATDGEHLSVPANVSLTLVNNKRSHLTAAAEISVTCQPTDVTRRLQEQERQSKENNRESAADSALSHSPAQNANAPVFEENFPTYITVSEDTAVGSVVLKISASDEDEGYEGQVVYVVTEGNTGGAFQVDTFTGDLKVLSALDHETLSEYNLTITAQDLGTPHKSASQVLKVFIGDENDNTPQFENKIYSKAIFEDVQVNSTVLQVLASDKDTGLNAAIRYSVLSSGEDFMVEPESGIIKVKSPLDRERQSQYTIIVQAEDSGLRRKLSMTTSVVITLNDINDNFPEFVPRTQTVRVREDLPVGTVITTLTAHDLDEGENAKVTYKLVDGADDKFQVDEVTGAVRIKNKLDFESTQVYNLTVKAEDGGEVSLESRCLVNIEVVDVNENHHAPEFSSFLEKGSVPENSPVGTYVLNVSARDKDDRYSSGGRITYSIRDGSGLGRFTIDNSARGALSQFKKLGSWTVVVEREGGLAQQMEDNILSCV